MQREMISQDNDLTTQTQPSGQPAQRRSSSGLTDLDRWLSSVGGGALAVAGVRRRGWLGTALAVAGSGLIWRGVSGGTTVAPKTSTSSTNLRPGEHGIEHDVEKSITINATPEELYQFWRNFENLPQFMDHLESVTTLDDTRSHWVAKAPAGTSVAWDAEIVAEQPNQSISWRSLPGADVTNTGTVRFVAGPEGRGTEVHVTINYQPPAGALGSTVAKLFGEEPNQQVKEDLRRLKRVIETGEIATIDGQSHGKRSALGKVLSPGR